MSSGSGPAWLGGFKSDYEKIFVEEWSPYVGALLLVMVIICLMLSGLVWGVFGGVKFWGDQINTQIGLATAFKITERGESFLTHRLSLMNIMLVLGAFAAALMSRQFNPSRPPKLEYIWASLGGTLLGLGAALAGGCTTGGFFNPVLHSSPAGWAMAGGLLIGAAIGLKLLLWTLENIEWGMQAPPTISLPETATSKFPIAGWLVVVGCIWWAVEWYGSADTVHAARAPILMTGFAIGFIMHRSRLCFSRAFREPFMTAEGDMTKAVILALAIGVPIAALLFQKKVIDPYMAIPATFWIGSFVGGLIFGIGMIFAGGCASGSLWRMGEGHIKMWVTMFFFSWSASTSSALLKKFDLSTINEELTDTYEVTNLGYQAYMPEMFGAWGVTLLITGVLLAVWYALVRYNETTERFTLL